MCEETSPPVDWVLIASVLGVSVCLCRCGCGVAALYVLGFGCAVGDSDLGSWFHWPAVCPPEMLRFPHMPRSLFQCGELAERFSGDHNKRTSRISKAYLVTISHSFTNH